MLQTLARFARDDSGASAVVIALCMTVLMGFAGMAVDVGVWYADKRSAQGAADAAAFSGAVDGATGDSNDRVVATAKAIAAQYGFTDGTGGVSVTVNTPPTSGTHQTAGAVEVIVAKTENPMLTTFFVNAASIKARAVALAGSNGGNYCVLALDPESGASVTTDIGLTGNATVDTSKCGMYVNGAGSSALTVGGSSTLLAKYLSIVGNYTTSGSGSLTVSGTKTTGASPVADPYASLATPTPGACAGSNSFQGTVTIQPGTYCNGFSANAGASVTMSPGVYVIDRGTFSLNGNSTVTGTGVTIVLTSSTGANYATMSINGGAVFHVTAPSSGATAGLAIVSDRNAPTSTVSTLNGGSTMWMTGAVYFPTQTVTFTGGNNTSSSCTQLIAYHIRYSGNSAFDINCAGVGVTQIGATATTLVE